MTLLTTPDAFRLFAFVLAFIHYHSSPRVMRMQDFSNFMLKKRRFLSWRSYIDSTGLMYESKIHTHTFRDSLKRQYWSWITMPRWVPLHFRRQLPPSDPPRASGAICLVAPGVGPYTTSSMTKSQSLSLKNTTPFVAVVHPRINRSVIIVTKR